MTKVKEQRAIINKQGVVVLTDNSGISEQQRTCNPKHMIKQNNVNQGMGAQLLTHRFRTILVRKSKNYI